MSETYDNEDILTGHAYDGIQEYDNPLPGWWKWLFILSVMIAPVYMIYFHSGVDGRSIHDDYDRHLASMFELRFEEIGELTPDRKTILEYMNEPKWLAVGKVAFKTNCVSCHGANGEGNVGVNLTDDYWKNVRNVEDIAKVVENGAANNAMPAWKNRLHQNQIVLVSAYIATLRDNPVAGGKPAEGEIVGPWEN